MSKKTLLILLVAYIVVTYVGLLIKSTYSVMEEPVEVISYSSYELPEAINIPTATKHSPPSIEELYGLPTGLLAAIHQVETSGRCNVVSKANAKGCFQFTPTTQKELVRLFKYTFDPFNYEQSQKAAAMYLSHLAKRVDKLPIRKQDKWLWVIAAYNGGFTNVRRWVKQGHIDYWETRTYTYKVKSLLEG